LATKGFEVEGFRGSGKEREEQKSLLAALDRQLAHARSQLTLANKARASLPRGGGGRYAMPYADSTAAQEILDAETEVNNIINRRRDLLADMGRDSKADEVARAALVAKQIFAINKKYEEALAKVMIEGQRDGLTKKLAMIDYEYKIRKDKAKEANEDIDALEKTRLEKRRQATAAHDKKQAAASLSVADKIASRKLELAHTGTTRERADIAESERKALRDDAMAQEGDIRARFDAMRKAVEREARFAPMDPAKRRTRMDAIADAEAEALRTGGPNAAAIREQHDLKRQLLDKETRDHKRGLQDELASLQIQATMRGRMAEKALRDLEKEIDLRTDRDEFGGANAKAIEKKYRLLDQMQRGAGVGGLNAAKLQGSQAASTAIAAARFAGTDPNLKVQQKQLVLAQEAAIDRENMLVLMEPAQPMNIPV